MAIYARVHRHIPKVIFLYFFKSTGNKYFIRSKKVFKMSYGRNERDEGYPKLFTDEFLDVCTQ